MNNYQQEIEEFDEMGSIEQWEWAITNKRRIKLFLDNDSTYFKYKESIKFPNLEIPIGHFYEYIGWSDGVFALLEALGFDAEGV